jgi:2-dehydro-3-deoxygluconokinase
LGFAIAGSESNVAIAAARVGLRCGWISRLVENPLGRKIEQELRAQGVDVSRVQWTSQGRVGCFYIEFGSPPRPTNIYYDRQGSAASQLTPDMLDWDYLGSATWFHTSSITCALSKSCQATVHQAFQEAHQRATQVSFELNYREKLWSPRQCRKTLEPLLGKCDLFIATAEDITRVFDWKGTPLNQLERLETHFRIPLMLLTAGSLGAWALDKETGIHELPFDRFPVTPIDRIGTGDAFTAGFLVGLIEKDIETGLLYGAACCALKYSIPGDLTLITREEMVMVAEGKGGGVRR